MGLSTLSHLQCGFESQVILVGKPLPPFIYNWLFCGGGVETRSCSTAQASLEFAIFQLGLPGCYDYRHSLLHQLFISLLYNRAYHPSVAKVSSLIPNVGQSLRKMSLRPQLTAQLDGIDPGPIFLAEWRRPGQYGDGVSLDLALISDPKAQSYSEKLFGRLPPSLTVCSSSKCMAFLALRFPHRTLLPPLTSLLPEKRTWHSSS